MKHFSLVSIDVGSAFTKVALRHGWNAQTALIEGMPSSLDGDESFCVPSVVAQVPRAGERVWLIGTAAAAQRPTGNVKVFTNWKSELFRNGVPSTASYDPFEVAVAFLRELRKDFLDRHPGARKFPARIAVPRLNDEPEVEALVRRIVRAAGWPEPEGRCAIYEPESNALGVLSRGRNMTWTPPVQDFRPLPQLSIHMQRMLEPGMSLAFRTMKVNYSALVTDVGAYTTDFGLIRFDASFKTDDWNRPDIHQLSVRLGIRQLDEAVLPLLEPEVAEYFRSQAPQEWERRKRELYAGRSQRLTIDGRIVEIGAGIESEAIQEEIKGFVDKVITARDEFQSAHQHVRVDEEALTGGGSAIATLRKAMLARMRRGTKRIHDLWDPREPEQATEAGAGQMSAEQKDARINENRRLVRAASAIGAASVFFEQ